MLLGLFIFLSAAAIAGALLCITRRNPVASVGWLVMTMVSLAGLFLLLDAQFVAIIQVLVYAGAVMVLFLFVIMLLNLGHATSDIVRTGIWIPAVALAVVLGVELIALQAYSPERLAFEFTRTSALTDPSAVFPGAGAAATATAQSGVLGAVAEPLFTQWLIPFELTSVLLLAAMVGAVVLAKRKI
ncbi:MAG TPA: NADH-quinone oxidoreductase subunit J [Gemmatimonadales bacterium]|nr:NADH-quinone oxidoreductase subunit J [Gemmatimonadales bacterium]